MSGNDTAFPRTHDCHQNSLHQKHSASRNISVIISSTSNVMNDRPFTRRDFLRTTALAVPLLAAGCAGSDHPPRASHSSKNEFVAVRAGRLVLRSKPYAYIGANMWFGCYLADAALPGGRARLSRELDRLQRIGATNLRLLAGSETSPLVGAISRGITKAPRDYDEDLLRGLDFCLAEMAQRDMRAILFLSNYWQWSGSFAQYVRWVTGENIPDPDQPKIAAGDWSAFMKMSARFYATPAANELYLAYVSHLLTRRNSINGRTYNADPTIMTWELANEPRPGVDSEETMKDVPRFCKWVDATARFIHERAPQQLVCTGSEGIQGSIKKPEVFIATHQTPAIDYVTVHMWLKNWGWLKDPVRGAEFEEAAIKARDHVEQHTQIATEVLHKPLVLEEFGLPRDHESYDPAAPTLARDEYYRRMFAQVAESCRAGRALQGANIWAWAGEGRASDAPGKTAASFTGDPFCEPQGLNSVFDTDRSTLTVIAKANEKLAALT
jgi:mannan endo-1,4-beta-mannosidase